MYKDETISIFKYFIELNYVSIFENNYVNSRKFNDPCAYVMQKFRRQITNWSSWNACRQRGGACLYTVRVQSDF